MKKYVSVIILIGLFIGLTTACGNSKINKNDSLIDNSEVMAEVSETQEITTLEEVLLSTETPFGDRSVYMEIKGIEQYSELKSDTYTDSPADGKNYVVIYLNLENYTEDNIYFNPQYLTAEVDGTSISSLGLVNDPKECQSIFQNVKPYQPYTGYVAFEVPQDWSNLDIVYSGWKDSNNVILKMALTPNDLFDLQIE